MKLSKRLVDRRLRESKIKIPRACENCGKVVPMVDTQKWCSKSCANSKYNKIKKAVKKCPVCGIEKEMLSWQKYCSAKCRNKDAKASYRSSSPLSSNLDLCTATIGAINELAASIWLMRDGYLVFRNQSPAGKADLVAVNNKTLYFLDVKSSCTPATLASVPPWVSIIYPRYSSSIEFEWGRKVPFKTPMGISL